MAKDRLKKQEKLIDKLYDKGWFVTTIADEVDLPYHKVWEQTKLREQGFGSYSDYREHLILERGFGSRSEYQEHLAREKGFGSRSEYQEHLARERQKNSQNKKLSILIKKRLKELSKNQSWLSNQLGVSRQIVSFYVQGKSIPKGDNLNNLFSTLGVPYKTLSDLIEDN